MKKEAESEMAEVDVVFRFLPKSGASVAVGKEGEPKGSKPIFLPLSQIEFEGELKECGAGEVIKVRMPEWMAIEKELI